MVLGEDDRANANCVFERLGDTVSFGRTVVGVSAGFGQLRDPS